MEQIFQFIATACGIAMAILGGLALLQNPRERSHQYFFLASLFCISWMISLILGFSVTTSTTTEAASMWFRIAHGSGIAALSFMLAFMTSYPQKSGPSSLILKGYLTLSLLFALFASSTALVYDEVLIFADGSLGDLFGPLYSAFIIHALGTELTGMILAIKKIRSAQGITRRKIQYAFFGFLCFSLATLVTNGILPVFDIILFQREAVLFSLFFLIPAFFSLYQHRFFHFSYSALNLTRHLILTFAFLASAGASYALISIMLAPQEILLPFISSTLIGLISYSQLSKRYPELISDEYLHFRSTLAEFKQNLLNVNTLHELQTDLEKTFMKKLNWRKAQLYRIGSKKIAPLKSYNKKRFSGFLRKHRPTLLVREEMPFLEDHAPFQKHLESLKADLLIPLYSHADLLGFLVINKGPEKMFGKEELQLLEELQSPLEHSFSHLLFKEGFFREKHILSKTLSEKTQQLREQFNTTKKLLKDQSDYISYAAHELKNPLAVLMLQLETSLSEKDIDPQTQEDLKSIEQSAEQLKALTQNLFSAQQYELDKVPFHPQALDLDHWFHIISQQSQTLVEKHQIHFTSENTLSKPMTLMADECKLTQVVQNIVNNAIKFTPENGNISIGLHESPLWIHLTISDTGPGIAPEDRLNVFKKYEHGSENTGLGLGLYLCKKIIQLHKGRIVITENPGGGTRVIIQLRKKPPLTKSPPHQQETTTVSR